MQQHAWLVYALLAAACAASINVLAKVGMKDVNADLATALRSVVQAALVAGFALIVGAWSHAGDLRGRPLAVTMILLSGVAGGLSWIFVFRSIQLADISRVAPVDKLSLPLGIMLAVMVLGERPTALNWLGIALVVAGAYLATMRA